MHLFLCLPCAPPDGRASAPPQVLPEREAARVLSVSMRTLQRWRLDGGGPVFVKLSGTRVGYLRADLESWLALRRFESTSAATMRRVAGAG